MKILTLLLTISSISYCQEAQPPPPEPEPTPTTPPYYDYVLNITFELDESKLSTFIVDLIYETPNEIPSEDALKLYTVPTITLEQTNTALTNLNISTSKVLSLDGVESFLQELDLQFAEVYTRLFRDRLKLQGDPLKVFLETLGIDVAALSSGLSFGTPDPWLEFKKGDFSEESLSEALGKVDRSQEELFKACKEEFLEKSIIVPTANLLNSLKKFGFDRKEALQLWKVLELTSQEALAIPVFYKAVNDIAQRLTTTSLLGILTDSNTFIVNSASYNIWKEASFANVFATSYNRNTRVQLLNLVDLHINDQIVGFQLKNFNLSSEATVYASTATTKSDLDSCQVVLPQGADLVAVDVTEVHNHGDRLHGNLNSTLKFVLGAPLVCQENVYGLARSIDEEDHEVQFDSFQVVHGSGAKSSLAPFALLGLVFVFRV